jgi:hypothetical protein
MRLHEFCFPTPAKRLITREIWRWNKARKLTAQRFRVPPDRRRARMESPWYLREMSRCEADESLQFDSVELPCVVSPAQDGQCLPDATAATMEKRRVAPKVVRDSGRGADLPDS